VRSPFNVNDPALRAGIAAIEDQAHVAAAIAHNARWRDVLAKEIAALGVPVTPSAANFLLIHLRSADEASAADAFLMARGLILRMVKAYGLPACLRLSVGSEEANLLVLKAFAEFAATRS
jgi:histidinol-phosphate aminotransferase